MLPCLILHEGGFPNQLAVSCIFSNSRQFPPVRVTKFLVQMLHVRMALPFLSTPVVLTPQGGGVPDTAVAPASDSGGGHVVGRGCYYERGQLLYL